MTDYPIFLEGATEFWVQDPYRSYGFRLCTALSQLLATFSSNFGADKLCPDLSGRNRGVLQPFNLLGVGGRQRHGAPNPCHALICACLRVSGIDQSGANGFTLAENAFRYLAVTFGDARFGVRTTGHIFKHQNTLFWYPVPPIFYWFFRAVLP